jgi:branched-chain amino acid transport system ATP-binding protein
MLLLDEPSAGLAPLVVQAIFTLVGQLREEGYTVLIVEQNIQQVLQIVDRAYLLETGRIRETGDAATLIGSDAVRRAYLGLL